MKAAPASLAELYATEWAPLVGLLVSISGSRSDAEKVAQEAFERLLRTWDKVGQYDEPKAWVRMVAVRMLISRHRRSRIAHLTRTRVAASSSYPSHADRSNDRVDISQAMGRLPIEQRTSVLLYYVSDLSVEAIAAEL